MNPSAHAQGRNFRFFLAEREKKIEHGRAIKKTAGFSPPKRGKKKKALRIALNRRADCAKTGVLLRKTPVFARRVSPTKKKRADARKIVRSLGGAQLRKNPSKNFPSANAAALGKPSARLRALSIELRSSGFANSRIRAPPHVTFT